MLSSSAPAEYKYPAALEPTSRSSHVSQLSNRHKGQGVSDNELGPPAGGQRRDLQQEYKAGSDLMIPGLAEVRGRKATRRRGVVRHTEGKGDSGTHRCN